MMATLLSAVDMRPALDENGYEIEIKDEFTGKNVAYDFVQAYDFRTIIFLHLASVSTGARCHSHICLSLVYRTESHSFRRAPKLLGTILVPNVARRFESDKIVRIIAAQLERMVC